MKEIQLVQPDVCSGDDTVQKVAQIMKEKKVRRLYVMKKKELKGIITTVDITNKLVAEGKDPARTKVNEIMVSPIKSISPEENLEEAIKIMNDVDTFVCPVVKGKDFLGVIRYQDIIASVVKTAQMHKK